jgi:hypothetical protein
MFDPIVLYVVSLRRLAGRPVEAHVYSVQQDDAVLRVTVAELADTDLGGSAIIDRAIKVISADRLQQRYFKVDDALGDAEQGRAAE